MTLPPLYKVKLNWYFMQDPNETVKNGNIYMIHYYIIDWSLLNNMNSVVGDFACLLVIYNFIHVSTTGKLL